MEIFSLLFTISMYSNRETRNRSTTSSSIRQFNLVDDLTEVVEVGGRIYQPGGQCCIVFLRVREVGKAHGALVVEMQ